MPGCKPHCDSSPFPRANVPFSVSTEIYQAQYRVLEAFALFNVILSMYFHVLFLPWLLFTISKVWGFLLLLLFLAWKCHARGERTVWTTPVTSVPWFHSGKLNEKNGTLPLPVTAPADRKRSKDAGAFKPAKEKGQQRAKPQDLGKIRTTGLTPTKTRQPSYEYKHGYWLPKSADAPPAPAPPPKGSTSRSKTRERRNTSQDRHDTRGRTQDRGRSHRSTKDRSLTRGNSGSKKPSARPPPAATHDRYHRDASPRR